MIKQYVVSEVTDLYRGHIIAIRKKIKIIWYYLLCYPLILCVLIHLSLFIGHTVGQKTIHHWVRKRFLFQGLDLPVLMPADREHLARCNLRWSRHSEQEVTRSAGLIVQQQALFLLHTDPCSSQTLSHTHLHTHACTHMLKHKCDCSHGCSRSIGWCIAACKAKLSVSFNSLSQRSNKTTAMHANIGHWPTQQHFIKADQSPRALTQPSTGKQKKTALIWTDRCSCSRCSSAQTILICVYTQTWKLTMYSLHNHKLIHNPEQLWHLWNCAAWESIQSLLSVQHWGHMFHIEWKSNNV